MNNDTVQRETIKVLNREYKINIYYDDYGQSPREWDNLGTIIYWHRDYILGEIDGRKDDIDPHDFHNQKIKEKAVILPVYLYDHSGITINTTGFSCRWDSGQVGYIFVDRATILKEFGSKILTKKLRQKTADILVAEIETFDKYIRGEVYGFQLVDENDNHIDSCWGFFSIEEAIEAAREYVPTEEDILNELKTKEQEKQDQINNLVGLA